MGLFEKETAVTRIADNQWRSCLTENWCVGTVPNGGYLMAIAARALSEALPHKDPLSMNGFYLAPTVVGECDIFVEVLSEGRSTTQAVAKLYQNGEQKIQFTAAFTSLDKLYGETYMEVGPPDIPPFEVCPDLPKAPIIKMQNHLIQKVLPGTEGTMTGGKLHKNGEWSGWLDFSDEHTVDAFALLFFSDAFPPPVFTYYGPTGWVPTLELTVQIRALPCPGPLKVHFSTKMLTQGVMEEDGEIWDSEDNLVAISRQTAKFRLPK